MPLLPVNVGDGAIDVRGSRGRTKAEAQRPADDRGDEGVAPLLSGTENGVPMTDLATRRIRPMSSKRARTASGTGEENPEPAVNADHSAAPGAMLSVEAAGERPVLGPGDEAVSGTPGAGDLGGAPFAAAIAAALPLQAIPAAPDPTVPAARGPAHNEGATPAPREPPRRGGLAGQVCRIEVENFMCHEHLVLDLSPHVTFISGRNGSGKSAVLAVLQVCLGVRAQKTGRAGAARELIRTGATWARARVTMWNEGEDAFEPSVYGRKLTVERKFGASSGVRLLGEDGRERASGVRAVDALVSHHAVHASNPVVVLTQDAARSFAGDASARDRYTLFAQAMRFDETDAHLRAANQRIADMGDSLREVEDGIKQQRRELGEKRRSLEAAQGALALREHARQAMRALAWGAARGAERDAARTRAAAAAEIPERVRRARADRDTKRGAIGALQRDIAAAREVVEDIERRQREATRDAEDAAQQLRRANIAVGEARDALAEARSTRECREADKRSFEESMQEVDAAAAAARAATENESGLAIAQLREAAQRARESREAADAAMQEASNSHKEALARLERAKNEVATAERSCRFLKDALRTSERELAETKASFRDPAAAFGEDVRKLAAAVREHTFQRPVLGPIGALVRVRDPVWRIAADAAIGYGMLQTFVVQSQGDARALRDLGERINVRPQVIVHSLAHGPYDLSGLPPPPPSAVTLDSVLSYPPGRDGELLRRVLIDHKGVERLLLLRDVPALRSLIADVITVRRCGVMAAWAADGSMGRRRGMTESVFRPGKFLVRMLTEESADEAFHNRVAEAQLRVDRDKDAVEKAKELVASCQHKQQEVVQQIRAAKERQTVASSELARSRVLDREAANALAEASNAMTAPSGASTEIDHLAEAQRQLEVALLEETSATEAFRAAEANVVNLQARRTTDQVGQLDAEFNYAMRRLRDLDSSVSGIEMDLILAGDALTFVEKEETTVKASLQEMDSIAEELLAAARSLCSDAEGMAALAAATDTTGVAGDDMLFAAEDEDADAEVEEKPTLTELQMSLSKSIKAVEQAERNAGGAPEELAASIATGELALRREIARQAGAATVFSELRASFSNRRHAFGKLRELVVGNVDKRFNNYLRFRNHSGQVIVNHEDREMRVKVTVNGSTSGVEDLRALSGGERSLTTVCLLLSLGHEGLRPPFHAMDEFDVFMDAANRRFAVAYLLEFAHKFSDRQFIFLTPNDLGVISEATDNLRTQKGLSFPIDFTRVITLAAPRET